MVSPVPVDNVRHAEAAIGGNADGEEWQNLFEAKFDEQVK